jgi:hypothetical protein
VNPIIKFVIALALFYRIMAISVPTIRVPKVGVVQTSTIKTLVLLLVSIVGTLYFLSLCRYFGAGINFIEPFPLGIVIEDIKNDSDDPALLINIFTNQAFFINPKETKKIETWLPNCNTKITFFGETVDQASYHHPRDRFLVLYTKKSLLYLVFGKSTGWKSSPNEEESLWVLKTIDNRNYGFSFEIRNYTEPISITLTDKDFSITSLRNGITKKETSTLDKSQPFRGFTGGKESGNFQEYKRRITEDIKANKLLLTHSLPEILRTI